jgi:DNA replication and repair protein RecF
MKYNKLLQHRNSLLKSGVNRDYSLMEVIDMRLVEFGNFVAKCREEFVEDFRPVFNKYYAALTNSAEQVEITYKRSVEGADFETSLKTNLEKDFILGYTSVGVHRDDLSMLLDGYPMKKIGSQGQKKSYIIAMKFALYEWLMRIKGVKPLLLLDDIFDKLDPNRVRAILDIVSGENFGQIFITHTHKNIVEDMLLATGADYKIFNIAQGEVVYGDR